MDAPAHACQRVQPLVQPHVQELASGKQVILYNL